MAAGCWRSSEVQLLGLCVGYICKNFVVADVGFGSVGDEYCRPPRLRLTENHHQIVRQKGDEVQLFIESIKARESDNRRPFV